MPSPIRHSSLRPNRASADPTATAFGYGFKALLASGGMLALIASAIGVLGAFGVTRLTRAPSRFQLERAAVPLWDGVARLRTAATPAMRTTSTPKWP
jgi:hypothetical protein